MAGTALAAATLCGLAAHLWTGPVTVPTPASVAVDQAASVHPPATAVPPVPVGQMTPAQQPAASPPTAPPTVVNTTPTTIAAPPTTAAPVVVTPDRAVVQGDGESGDGPDAGER